MTEIVSEYIKQQPKDRLTSLKQTPQNNAREETKLSY